MHRAEAVGARVAASDDDDTLAGGADRRGLEHPLADEIRRLEVVHREMDPAKIPSRHQQVAWAGGAGGEHDCVELPTQLPDGDHGRIPSGSTGNLRVGERGRRPDGRPDAELGPFVLHLCQPAVEHGLFELELGDAVAEQPADALGTLEDHDRVARPG